MTEQATRRTVDRHGEDLKIRNYDHGDDERHGDGEPAETADSPHAARGRVADAGEPTDDRDVGRTRLAADVRVFLRDDADGLDAMTGVGGDTPPSRIERPATGETFRVIRVSYQNNGLVRADARVV